MNKILKKLGNYEEFLDEIFKNLEKNKIDVSELFLDHICYRVSSDEKYNILKKEIEKNGMLLIESMVGGRKISTFKLNFPIIYKNRKINILEIPAPKQGSNYKDGFEHIEFIIKDDFKCFMKKYSHINFITKALVKENNPDIKIKYGNISVKFHKESLENIILKEKNIQN